MSSSHQQSHTRRTRTAATNLPLLSIMLSSILSSSTAAFISRGTRGIATKSQLLAAKAGQAEVVLVGCGAPNRGMGWYHAIQMLEGRYVFMLGFHCLMDCLMDWLVSIQCYFGKTRFWKNKIFVDIFA